MVRGSGGGGSGECGPWPHWRHGGGSNGTKGQAGAESSIGEDGTATIVVEPETPDLTGRDVLRRLANEDPCDDTPLHFRGQKNQIDHVLVSRALEDKVTAVGVDRSGIAEIAKLTAGAEQPSNPCAASPTGATPPPTMARSG